MTTGGVRFTDILTSATSVATYLGAPVISASHVIAALDLLEGRASMEDLGRPVSPLVARRAAGGPPVDEPVRLLVQRWWDELGRDPQAALDAAGCARLRLDLASLQGGSDGPRL